MATKTDKYELRKKEDNDFYNIDDFNDNMDKIETALTEFDDSGSADGITSFTDMLTKLVTGNKLAVTLRNLKAGLQFVLHAGSIVNNCVTDNAKLPLAAAQGKALQDAITKLNSELSIESYKVTNWGCEIIKANYVRKYGKVVHVYFNFTVKADHVAPYISLFALPCKPISMVEVLPPFFRRIDGTQIPTRYLSDYGVIQSTYTLDVSSDYVFEWVFICE